MNNKKVLIVTNGFFGDIAFASSIAKKLKEENDYILVDYFIGFPQMKTLLENNPYINKVLVSDSPSPNPYSISINTSEYDEIIKLPNLSFTIPPPLEYQIYAKVKNPDTEYKIYTNKEYDKIAEGIITELKENGKKVVCVMSNWKSKTYLFTEDQYKIGIDTPNLGYGGRHRDVEFIVKELNTKYNIIEVGYPQEVNQNVTSEIQDNNQKSILFECSLMKFSDAFIGTEGGLCNLAAGVGTKTIITGDFVHQLYGWNGVLKKIKEPKLGPIHYFLNSNHIELNPYITDIEVLNQIINYV